MTNAEAIETLRANYPDACYEQLRKAVDVAIEALTALQTDGDTISRQGAIDALSILIPDKIFPDVESKLKKLPSVQPTRVNTSNTLQTLDCVDRQALIDTAAEYENELREILGDENELVEVVKILKHRLIALPSVQPEPCDAISRADAIRVASGYCHPANVAEELAKLPSVQPEPHYTDDQIQKMQDMEQAQLNKAFELGRKDAKWIPCSERLPEETVLVTAETKTFRHRYICEAVWIPRWTWKASFDNWEDCLEYNEDEDEFYVNEGWYERVHNWDEYSYVEIEDTVLAWMPLPEPYREEGENR